MFELWQSFHVSKHLLAAALPLSATASVNFYVPTLDEQLQLPATANNLRSLIPAEPPHVEEPEDVVQKQKLLFS